MPNTIGHIAVQGPLSKFLFRDADPRWIFLGCIIPDIPWILQRAVIAAIPYRVDPYDLRIACVVLASLFASLVLSLALAFLSARPKHTFALLAVGSSMHLVLDATQIKWANGVHLVAPFSWELTRFDLFWPESLPTLLMTVGGLIAFFQLTLRSKSYTPFTRRRRQWLAAAMVLVVYGSLPSLFRNGPEDADNHFVMTLRNPETRPGAPIEFDRASYHPTNRGYVLQSFSGEEFFLAGPRPERAALVSIRGDFVDERTIRIRDSHIHAGRLRDWASVVGLALVAASWVIVPLRRSRTG